MAIPTYQSQAIPVISLQPDWSTPPKWRQRYSTIITEALDTTEERQARQPRALYGLTYKTRALSAAETAYLRTLLETSDDLPVACPLWPLGCQLTAAASAGATSLTLDDTADCLFEVFAQYALLWQSYDHWEVVELDAVSDNGATLLAATSLAYTANPPALLLPLAYGHVPRGPVEQMTDEHGAWECQFIETFHRLHDQSVPEDLIATFDPTPCLVTEIENGGGTTFDCYDDGAFTEDLPVAAVGLSAHYVGNSPFGYAFGDDFESYEDGALAEGVSGGDGYTTFVCG